MGNEVVKWFMDRCGVMSVEKCCLSYPWKVGHSGKWVLL